MLRRSSLRLHYSPVLVNTSHCAVRTSRWWAWDFLLLRLLGSLFTSPLFHRLKIATEISVKFCVPRSEVKSSTPEPAAIHRRAD
ncbi:hypothetical protein GDO78_019459 [Eleutherodactylus coqui]|uniref:Uncharacterized protein n=1 Tax=Eleutherodactylus coqui TaxID=57060 RepID=A0A8J6EIW0_ELECQ|nr:hypothetical protein GDO78_019459 [Eleutherodactylus coqui]